jgi:3-oxoacyl-[acyl-carrier protein] reductase
VSDLTGQIALVTGAGSSRGIGFATARHLAADGARVVLVGVTARVHERAVELCALHGESCATSLQLDLTDTHATSEFIASSIDEHGRIDIVVNNAGMIVLGEEPVDTDIAAYDDVTWQLTIERNLTTAFAVIRSVAPAMRSQGYGRIINVASTSGPVQAFVGDVGYHAAKAGMVGLTRAVALELAGDGVTVNAVAPGWIATDSQTSAESQAGRRTPVGRSGTADEIAAVIRFLADPSASYLTGQVITVDGGNSLPEDRTWVSRGR